MVGSMSAIDNINNYIELKKGSLNYHISEYERIDQEKYYTPTWVWDALFDKVDFTDKTLWEPACGNGEGFSNSLGKRALASFTGNRFINGWHLSDLYPENGICTSFYNRPLKIQPHTFDFLQANVSSFNRGLDCHIVTNPPYGKQGVLAEQFIETALERVKPQSYPHTDYDNMPSYDRVSKGGKVAMLLRIDFDSAKRRTKYFRDHPAFDSKLVLLNRIKWTNLPNNITLPNGETKDNGQSPKNNHAWYIWDWARYPSVAPRILYSDNATLPQ